MCQKSTAELNNEFVTNFYGISRLYFKISSIMSHLHHYKSKQDAC